MLSQEWVYVPMLVDWKPSLAENKPSHTLWQGTHPASGGRAQHYTNVKRVWHLAMSHPLVEEVEPHKAAQADDRAMINSQGRAMKGHQSEHDLKFTLAASGTTRKIGASDNKCHPDLLSLVVPWN